ncbi:type ISP restriction/modification enzyme [Rhodobium gokarnense]|uniref:site-specific DNA-methyltransferase (adenine-specific) n=1 Tax=Rhodobium gokarnense TaxID=364296 RepID=A0ABT3HCB1_9HYPH|nr:type ISP restriction/modification enzyme [Rhodobium gokarnense]MCW2308030.1 putative helicase [Rhodobium gokarnense]
MAQYLIQEYFNAIDRLKQFSGTATEQVIREAFKDLLKNWAKGEGLIFIPELEYETARKTKVYPDGTVLHDLRVPLGFWEAKDTADDIDTEIAKKFSRGYPQDNIVFENSKTAVLWQNRQEVLRCDMRDGGALAQLVLRFFDYERPEIAEFRKAVEQFKADLPFVLEALREKIDAAYARNKGFKAEAERFLTHVKDTVNPTLGEADVREMLIQHILTEEIFNHVFNEGDFHRENNIAKALYALEAKFFTGAVKRETLKGLERYYAAIRANAAQISGHSEKQAFLKVIYESFYKVYNPKAADRLGVVYTPNEIVRFMIEGADWLCREHFGRGLIDKHVEILDPATGTGTFICELLEHFRGQRKRLAEKYKNELHANEVAILPYYVANLNIEATYAAITGQYAEFPSLCFVDTLDNVDALGIRTGHQHDLFGAMSEENIERIQRQNRRKISVIIGNPPYNANQQNENENNKNRTYRQIDEAIKATYIRASTAQKTKLYDMYARFFRWASDRLHDDGVIAFITNRSFIDSRTFDGFRKVVAEEFAEIWVVDLGGDVRANPKLSGTTHNVFGIQTGVAISFLVKKRGKSGAVIHYARRPEMERAEDKLAFLAGTRLSSLSTETIVPSKRNYWINQVENDWEELVPIADKKAKLGKTPRQERALFKLFSLGVVTSRDSWVYDFDQQALLRKVNFFVDKYESERKKWSKSDGRGSISSWVSREIKWTSELEDYLRRQVVLKISSERIRTAEYRPFVKMYTYYDRIITHRIYQQDSIFPIESNKENFLIVFTDPAAQKPWLAHSVNRLPDLHFVGPAAGTVCTPRYRYTSSGERVDNITDWGLRQFEKHYGKTKKKPITKDAIFHYCYGVLHDPVYREKYAINLKREFPRIPFYPDFWQWADWGERLMDLHIGYETVEPWPLQRTDVPDERAREADQAPTPKLKADRDNGIIVLDSETQLSSVPPECWAYKLGNRSGLEWILDQYKEKKPRDPTIREKFNTYRFADYKETVIDLLMRVTRVSVETMAIVAEMTSARR